MNGDSTSSSAQVQGTNHCSIVSKLSMVNQGYLEDQYLKYFVEKPQRRSPVINRGYYIRSKAVRHVVSKFVAARKNQAVQIVSLGAGFDTTFFNVRDILGKKDVNNLKFVEVDYPAVMEKKVKLAEAANLLKPEASQPTDKNIISRNQAYSAIGFDLRRVGPELKLTLQNCGLNLTTQTLFLSEVVFTYLTSIQSQKVMKWIKHTFNNALLVVFEQMLPDNGFGRVMTRHFDSCGSPLLAIRDYPTLATQIKRHQALGFNTSSGIDLYSFFEHYVPAEEKEKLKNLEIFDEYEAWHQTCLHYFILCSTNSDLDDLKAFCQFNVDYEQSELSNDDVAEEEVKVEMPNENMMQLFGHCAYGLPGNNMETQQVLSFGGFGIGRQNTHQKSSHHRRLFNITLTNLETKQFTDCTPKDINVKATQYSTLVRKCPSDSLVEFVLFGGRGSPKLASNDVHLISYNTKTKECKIKYLEASGIVPGGRCRHTADVMTINKTKNMIVFGGRDEKNVFGDCWYLDLDTWKWSKITLTLGECDIELKRHSHSSAVWSTRGCNTLILSGGLNSHERPSNSIYTLDLHGSEQASIDRLNIHPELPAIYSHNMHVCSNYLIIVGGVKFPATGTIHKDPQCLCDEVYIIDLLKNAWIRTVKLQQAITDTPLLLYGHKSFVLRISDSQVEIVVCGGGTNCFSFGTSLNRTPLLFSIPL